MVRVYKVTFRSVRGVVYSLFVNGRYNLSVKEAVLRGAGSTILSTREVGVVKAVK